jgi:solute carrier family 26 (sodium-independent sulfate anion transporter), member 11
MTVVNLNSYGDEAISVRRRIRKSIQKTCSKKTLKKRVPILNWLPKYNFGFFIQDVIAGITVGLTAIPQGIAYAIIAGLPAEYGLYASIADGFIYAILGSSKDITIGPTAVLSTLTAKYASYSVDFAVLAAFLSGIIMLLMGIFHLGILVNFISTPVINGFTTAAAIQIAASQLKAFFALNGKSGNYFAESIKNFVNNIKTAKLWDPILGTVTIIMLCLLKYFGRNCNRTDGWAKKIRWFMCMSRNAVVVIFGMIVAFILKITTDSEPLKLIGVITPGLPPIGPPPFSTSSGNETLNFVEMLTVLGPPFVILPLVAILESVAIAKAFAVGGRVDATQEMIALGICSIVGSFFKSLPTTGSFTRTALNYASGVQTPAGGVTKSLLIIAALSLLTSTFYFIPNASLAGLIITAMYSMLDLGIFVKFWRNSKKELFLSLVTIVVSLFLGLEYGIVIGVLLDSVMLLYSASQPRIVVETIRSEDSEMVTLVLSDKLPYCAAEYVRKAIVKVVEQAGPTSVLVIDGVNVQSMDTTVATNLMNLIMDYEKVGRTVILLNFQRDLINLCIDIQPKVESKFVFTTKPLDLVDIISKQGVFI